MHVLPNIVAKETWCDRLQYAVLRYPRTKAKAAVLYVATPSSPPPDILEELLGLTASSVRLSDSVTVLNASTVGVLLTELQDNLNVLRVVEYLFQACERFTSLNIAEGKYKPSIGISICPDDASTATSALVCADTAWQSAQSHGPLTVSFYSDEMNVQMHRRKLLQERLEKALVRNEFQVYAQPVFAKKNMNMHSVELLLRWIHPDEGPIPASLFMEFASRKGLWLKTSSILEKELIANSQMHPHLTWTWNAPHLLRNPYHKNIDLPFQHWDSVHPNMGLEVSSELLVEHPEQALHWIKQWKHAGGFVCIDDFGKHPIQLEWLQQLAPRMLKTTLPVTNLLAPAIAKALNASLVYKQVDDLSAWQNASHADYGQGNTLQNAEPIHKLVIT
jgi:EAL domain-containing protein (putative c-di-GMP-specific phosphodiesterase class I)